mmetsp:Transcript_45575/g.117821  ORF Transcript_45575/g.117821 Transcript_45575/m.117821 type:complete len:285 (-) Transcript_45575:189-1043(-)
MLAQPRDLGRLVVARVEGLEARDARQVRRELGQGQQRRPDLGLLLPLRSRVHHREDDVAETAHGLLERRGVLVRPERLRREMIKVLDSPDRQRVAMQAAGREHLPQDIRVLVGLERLLEERAEVGEVVYVLAPLHISLLRADVHELGQRLRRPIAHLQHVYDVVVHQPHHGEEAGGEDLGVQPDQPRATEVRGHQELPHQGLAPAAAAAHVREALRVYDPQRSAAGHYIGDLHHVRATRHRLERAVRLREEPGIASRKEARQDTLATPRGADDRERVDAARIQI